MLLSHALNSVRHKGRRCLQPQWLSRHALHARVLAFLSDCGVPPSTPAHWIMYAQAWRQTLWHGARTALASRERGATWSRRSSSVRRPSATCAPTRNTTNRGLACRVLRVPVRLACEVLCLCDYNPALDSFGGQERKQESAKSCLCCLLGTCVSTLPNLESDAAAAVSRASLPA